uniref:Titin n=1 Tax=Cyprinus carpio TaxID=7962 RepID=A0A8C1MUR0_CYPCA
MYNANTHFFASTEEALKIIVPLEDCEIEEKKTMTFTCKVNRPNVTVQWMKAGQEITFSKRILYRVDKDKHTLTIKDCSLADEGEYSVVAAKRPITPPGPPSNIKLKDWSKSYADLVWTKPSRDGGSPILGYVVECQKSGSAQWDRINKDLIKFCVFRVPGLSEGTEYRFRIRASNKVGDGEPRELTETVLAKDILVPPDVTVDVACRDLITVRAGQIINLVTRVKGRPDPEITWTKDARVLGRDKRTEMNNNFPLVELVIQEAVRADYGKYAIQAKNSSGQAQATIIVNVLDIPGACQNLKVAYVTKDSCMVSWENPEDNGGTEITNYKIECRQPSQRGWTVVTSDYITKSPRVQVETGTNFTKFLLTNSRRGDSGKYIISATNTAGICSAEAKVNVLDRPGPIRDLKVSDISVDRCKLTWEIPEDDGGCEIYNYIIEKCETKRGVWSIHSAAIITNSAKVTRLIEGNEYIFRVRAENKMGAGSAVETESIVARTQFSRPGAPDAPEVTKITKEEMVVMWCSPDNDGGKPITGYILEKKEEHAIRWAPVVKSPIAGTQMTVTGLLPNHEYQFRVRAENEIGTGDASKPSRSFPARDPVGMSNYSQVIGQIFVC